MLLGTAGASFLLAFPALFSIVNPLGGALIYHEVTGEREARERAWLAGRVGVYSALVMLGALWAGAYILNFFGISLAALRIAGGLVVAVRAWEMLAVPERQQARKQQQAAPAGDASAVAFFPLTMPFTTGPGTMSVAIALSAERPAFGQGMLAFYAGASAAALLLALIIWIAYRWSDRLLALLGPAGARTLARLVAFLLLCIGTQIVLTGISEVLLTRPAG